MIQKNASVPMYEQISTQLREEILDKKYGSDGNIGTHNKLAQRFGVSLITVRRAIAQLVEQGLVEVVQGKGTFVKNPLLRDDLTRLTGVQNILSDSHLSAEAQVLTFEIIDTPAHFDLDLRKGLGKKCLHIRRVHQLEDVKAAYAEIWLPLRYGEELTKADVEKHTIYQLYEDKWHMTLGKGRQIIRADAASPAVSAVLDIPEGWPVLSIVRRAYSAQGELVEYMQLTYEYSQYAFEVELQLSAI